MVLDFNNYTYDNKREFRGNKDVENVYIWTQAFIRTQLSPLENQIAHIRGIHPTLRTTDLDVSSIGFVYGCVVCQKKSPDL